MAIVFPITFPVAPAPLQVRIRPGSAVSSSRSPFTRDVEVFVHQGQWWEMSLDWPPPMDRADASAIIAALLSLNGEEGTFLFGNPTEPAPRGSAKDTPGTPLVAGAGQTGQDLAIDGAPANETGWLLKNDLVQIGAGEAARLHKVLLDVDTDGGGAATLTLFPRVRTAPADNAAVVISNAVGLWRLAPGQWDWEVDRTLLYGLSFNALSEV